MTLWDTMLASVIVMFVAIALFMFPKGMRKRSTPSAANMHQIVLAASLYGNDHDNRIPLAINGRWSGLQNRTDTQLTIACPGPGTQELASPDAGLAKPTRTWVHLLFPYVPSMKVFVNPEKGDPLGLFDGPPLGVGDLRYNPLKCTYRNQGRFAFYGLNYMFLAPIRIPDEHYSSANSANYAVGVSKTFEGAEDPTNTVFFLDSQRYPDDKWRGFFVVNAPGMWTAFINSQYIGFWNQTRGSGDWVGTKTACANKDDPCRDLVQSAAYGSIDENGGATASFLDGHVKHMMAADLAAGTDYTTAVAGGAGDYGSGARIIDKKRYLWNYDGDFYGL